MSIIKNYKDKLKQNTSKIKLAILKYITPVEYIEFTFKMLMVFSPVKVETCLWYSTMLLVSFIIVSLIAPIAVTTTSCIMATLFSVCFNLVFCWWRKKVDKKGKFDYTIAEVRIKDKSVDTSVNVPKDLEKYI